MGDDVTMAKLARCTAGPMAMRGCAMCSGQALAAMPGANALRQCRDRAGISEFAIEPRSSHHLPVTSGAQASPMICPAARGPPRAMACGRERS